MALVIVTCSCPGEAWTWRKKLCGHSKSGCPSSSGQASPSRRASGADSGVFDLNFFVVETPPPSISPRGPGGRVCREFPLRGQWDVLTSEEERDPVGPGSALSAALVCPLTFGRVSLWDNCENSVPHQVWDFTWVIFRDLCAFSLRGKILHRRGQQAG